MLDPPQMSYQAYALTFGQFAEALRQQTETNPISHERKPLDNNKKGRLFSTKQSGNKIKGFIYCNKEDHKSIQS